MFFGLTHDRPVWDRDGADWPNRDASRFLPVAGVRWHVQEMGAGPIALLVHGTGASTHSWRDIAPLLARHFTVVAPDLPGHGFTETHSCQRLSLPMMARSVGELMQALGTQPALAIGHSAGAAILLRATLDKRIDPQAVVSLNGALMPFGGVAGQIFPPMAKILFLNPLAPRLFAWGAAERSRVERLIEDTGSTIDDFGLDLYMRLFRRSAHVAGALGMMANWDLEPLQRDLPRLPVRVLLLSGSKDRAVSPETAVRIASGMPNVEVEILEGLGHLAHEERPHDIAEVILTFARTVGILPAAPA